LAGAGIGVKIAKDFLQAGDELDKFNRRTGISVEQIQRLKFAAQQSGTSIETIEKAFLRSTRVIGDAQSGLKEAEDTLVALGLSVEDLANTHPDELFYTFADALVAIESPLQKAQLAQELFGRSGAQLLPLLEDGAEGVRLLTDEAERNGNIMSTEAAQAAAKFNDTLNELKQIGLSGVTAALSALVPHLTALAQYVKDEALPVMRDFGRKVLPPIGDAAKFIARNFDIIGPILAGLTASIIAFKAIAFAKVLIGIVAGVKAWIVAQGALNVALAANPIGLVVVAIGALVTGLIIAYQKSETFRNIVHGAFERVRAALQILLDTWQTVFGIIGKVVGEVGGFIAKVFGIGGDNDKALTHHADMVDRTSARIAGSFRRQRDEVTAAVTQQALNVEEITRISQGKINTTLSALETIRLKNTLAHLDTATKYRETAADRQAHLLDIYRKSLADTQKEEEAILEKSANVVRNWANRVVGSLDAASQSLRDYIRNVGQAANQDVIGRLASGAGLEGGGLDFLGTNLGQIPQGASGGIVTRPTLAVIGEGGPEAVIPLNRAPGASALPVGTSSPQTINVILDGQTLSQFVINTVNQASRAGQVNAIAAVQ